MPISSIVQRISHCILSGEGVFFGPGGGTMNETLISAGELSARVTAQGEYGWCGLSDLIHTRHRRRWHLSPVLTLEHYIGIPPDSPDYIWYEPCESPKSLDSISPDGCTLRYGSLECSKVDCTMSYRMVAPHYVDMLVEAGTARAEWPIGSRRSSLLL